MDKKELVEKDNLSTFGLLDQAAGFDRTAKAEVFRDKHDKARGESCETRAYEVDFGGICPKERERPEVDIVAGVSWRPAGKHTGTVCRAQPAPHHSDGGFHRGVSVWDGEPLDGCLVEEVEEGKEYQEPIEGAEEVFLSLIHI